MAHTHEQVAAAFANGKKVRRGGNMYNELSTRPLHDWSSTPATAVRNPARSGLFTEVGRGYSYRTKICQIVVNHHTQKSELWITPSKYSMSTNRHEELYRHAFIRHYIDNHKVDYPTASAQVFYTPAVDDGGTRCNPAHALRVMEHIHRNTLPAVDKPRLREATRRGAIAAALGRMQTITHRMTAGVPLDAPDAETLYECQSMTAFLENTQALTDIDEVRTAMRAWLTLNDPSHN
jgi:hypothetical protein